MPGEAETARAWARDGFVFPLDQVGLTHKGVCKHLYSLGDVKVLTSKHQHCFPNRKHATNKNL